MSFALVDSMRGLAVLPRVIRLYPAGHERVAALLEDLVERLGAAVEQRGGALRLDVVAEGVRADGEVFAGAVANRLRDLFMSRGISGLEIAGAVGAGDLQHVGELLGRAPGELADARRVAADPGAAVRVVWSAGPEDPAAFAPGATDVEWDDAAGAELPDGWQALPSGAATRALDGATLHDVARAAARNRVDARTEPENAARIAAILLLTAPTHRQRARIRAGLSDLALRSPATAGSLASLIEKAEPDLSRRLLRLLLPVLPPATVAAYAASAAPEPHEIPLFLARCRESGKHGEVLLRLLLAPLGDAWTRPLVQEVHRLIEETPEKWTEAARDRPELLDDPGQLRRLLAADVRLVSVLLFAAPGPESPARGRILDALAAIGTDAAFAALTGALDEESVLADRDVLETVCRFKCMTAGNYLASLVEEAPTIMASGVNRS